MQFRNYSPKLHKNMSQNQPQVACVAKCPQVVSLDVFFGNFILVKENIYSFFTL